ncbi:porin [Kaistia soli]|nr:porin [Kaistia soli]
MMHWKTKLLCSAATLMIAGSAQAADLTVAEPVDYVKVCDAFGAGFFYSPGTDTCIKVGGYVKFGTSFGDTDFGTYNSTYPKSQWSNFYTEASVQLTASSVTEYGNLTGFLDYRAQSGNSGSFTESASQIVNSSTNSAYVDSAWLSIGPVKAGRFTSLYDFGRGYTDTGSFGSDQTTDHIQVTYAVNGFGLALSVEDQRDRGSAGATDGVEESDGTYYSGGQDNIPDIVAALTYASGIFSTKIAAAYVNNAEDRTGAGSELNPYIYTAKTGFAVGGSVEFALDAFSPGDKFFITGNYGDNANSYTGISGGTSVANLTSSLDESFIASAAPGSSWSALASYKHVWTPAVWSAVTGGYASYDGDGYFDNYTVDAYRGVFSTGWTPVTGLDLMLDAQYSHVDVSDGRTAVKNEDDGDAWAVNLWMKRSW